MNNALVLWCQYVNTIYISGNEIVCQEAMNNSSFGKSSASTHFVLRCLSWQCRCFAFASLDTSQMRPESTNLGRRPLRLLKHFETISCCFWSELSFFQDVNVNHQLVASIPRHPNPPTNEHVNLKFLICTWTMSLQKTGSSKCNICLLTGNWWYRQEWHSNFQCALLLLAGVIAGGADVARLLHER